MNVLGRWPGPLGDLAESAVTRWNSPKLQGDGSGTAGASGAGGVRTLGSTYCRRLEDVGGTGGGGGGGGGSYQCQYVCGTTAGGMNSGYQSTQGASPQDAERRLREQLGLGCTVAGCTQR